MSSEPRLLVIDDEEAICEGCRRIFSRQGFGVEKCCDANEGLNLATKSDFSAILLDIKMPGMDGIHFLEELRKEKPSMPVVLMTGYPSIPNAVSAIRLGISDYVTKPFTPEEISQAVHRLLQKDANGEATPAPTQAPAAPTAHTDCWFFRNAWFQAGTDSAAKTGALVVRPGVTKVQSIRLPRIGEVVYQGLPMASVSVADQPAVTVPAPLSGIIVGVNDALEADPSALLSDPCDQGWIASISPTRREEEAKVCHTRRVILLSRNQASADESAKKLTWLGCEVRVINQPLALEGICKEFDSHVLLFDATSFGVEGPGIVGEINAKEPGMKVIVLAPEEPQAEPAYRMRRIFYYAVEPFADNEITEILDGVFSCPVSVPHAQHRELAQALCSLSITNKNGSRVRLVAAPGLLRHEEGLGQLLRHKLMQRLFPLESSPSDVQITPMTLLSLATRCDRVLALVAQDFGRLPGSLSRDTKAEYVALVGPGADKVTTFLVQPSATADAPLAFEPAVLEALAEHIVREMASA